MKVLFVSLNGFSTPHFETDLELAEGHLLGGDEVTFLSCHSGLLLCDWNWNQKDRFSLCVQCIKRTEVGVRLLKQPISSTPFLLLTQENRDEISRLPRGIQSAESLRAIRVDDFDLGTAVLSSLMSWLRDPLPEVRLHANVVDEMMVSALAVYRSVQNHLAASNFDRVYVFNARLAQFRAVLRACQSRGVDCYVHERGRDSQHYCLDLNAISSNRDIIEKRIFDHWKEIKPETAWPSGRSFYEGKVEGAHFSFNHPKTAGRLPADWNPELRNIVIFGSSEDEFAAHDGSYSGGLYRDQLDGMSRILESFGQSRASGNSAFLNTRIYYRLHPFLSGVHNRYVDCHRSLKAEGVTVIQPEDDLNSYTLLQACGTVITFGSTMGIEANYWGKPSILLGRATYESLGGTHNPRTHEELMEMLAGDVPILGPLPAVMFGSDAMTFGAPLEHFAEEPGKAWGTFKGTRVLAGKWTFRALAVVRAMGLLPAINRLRNRVVRRRLGLS